MPLRSLLTLLLVTLLPLTAAAAPAARSAAAAGEAPRVDLDAPVEGHPAAFDRLFEELDLGGLTAATPERAREQLAELRRLLPSGDARRDLKYRYLACRLPPEDAAASLEAASRGLADARRLGDEEAQIRFLYCRGNHRQYVAAPRDTLSDFEAGLQLARRKRDWRLVADGLIGRGHARSLTGEHAHALIDFLTAQDLYRSAGKQRLAQDNIINLAIAYRRMGEYDKAITHLKQGYEEARRRKDWTSQVVALLQQGFLYDEMKQPAQAQASYQQLLDLAREHNGRSEMSVARLGMSAALIAQGQFRPALTVLDQAEADFAAVQDSSNQPMIDLRRGQALAGLGRYEEALEHFDAAAAVMEEENNERYLAMLLPERSRTYEALGRMQPALDDYKRFLDLRQKLLDALAEQRTVVMRHQFDATRRDLENQRLTAEKALREQELGALLKARRWQWSALGLGAALVIVLIGLVLRQVMRTRRLSALAMTDELTSVANRRSIELTGEEIVARARADSRPLTALALDIDHFKKINDVHGHHAGDRVLARVAVACQGALRQFDQLGRIGGEEFLVLLPNTAADAGVQVAERLRGCVESLALDDVARGLRVTVSVGMAELRPTDADFKALVHRADLALYRAKANGRNRLEREEIPAPPTLQLVQGAKR